MKTTSVIVALAVLALILNHAVFGDALAQEHVSGKLSNDIILSGTPPLEDLTEYAIAAISGLNGQELNGRALNVNEA